MAKTLVRAAAMFVALSPIFSWQALAQDSAGGAEATPAVLELRRHFHDYPLIALTAHSIESIFQTRPVKAGQPALPYPSKLQPLAFEYSYKGERHRAEDALDRTYTNALLIIREGAIVYENYRNFTTPSSRFLSASVAKSITSILIGIAIDDGSIRSVDDQIVSYLPELKGSAFDGVSIRDALDMKTGVDRRDTDPLPDGSPLAIMREQTIVRNQRLATDEALIVGRKAPPGQIFEYSTLNVTVLGWLLQRATGQPVAEYTSNKLWKPLGAESGASWMVDGSGTDARTFAGMGFNAVMRDYARIGTLMLNRGSANGRQIVSERWVDESVGGPHMPVTPGAARGYHHLWWTVPGERAFMAVGMHGQAIFVDPDTKTVIVKLSYQPLPNREPEDEAFAFMMAAARAGKWK